MATLAPTRLPLARLNKSLLIPMLLVLVAILAVGVALLYLFGKSADAGPAPAEKSYQTVPVTRGTITNAITASGPITDPTAVPLTFKRAGRVAAINVKVGQRVEAGQELAQLETADLQAAVDQAQAAVNEATAAHTRLVNPSAAASSSSLAADVRAARATVAATEKDLETAKVNAAQVMHQAQASLESAQVKLQNAQRTTASTVIQAQTAADADHVEIESAFEVFTNAQDLHEKAIASSMVAYQNALREYNDALASGSAP